MKMRSCWSIGASQSNITRELKERGSLDTGETHAWGKGYIKIKTKSCKPRNITGSQ